ncbi:MBL fold metallo-hydrolase [Chlamydiota bacterium]
MTDSLKKIAWLGHASFRVTDTKTIYIDPWKISGRIPADIILITHDHYDHFSPEDIKKISHEKTEIVTPFPITSSFVGKNTTVKPGTVITIDGYGIRAVPAYNIEKSFHPQSNLWVGYILELPDGTRIYHTGDSDFVPEMRGITADVVLLPIGGTYTMDAEEAARCVEAMNVDCVIPMHFGDIVGSKADCDRFQRLVKKKVVCLGPEQ